MIWHFLVRQKIKLGLLLFLIMSLIIVSSLVSKQDMKTINSSFSSIYTDRLLPATDLFYMSEHMFAKRVELEQFLYSENPVSEAELRRNMKEHNRVIDTLIHTIEATYLVEQESQYLDKLKKDIAANRALENSVISLSVAGKDHQAQSTFNITCGGNLLSTINDLNKLVKIQTDVGKNLVDDCSVASSSISFMHGLLIVITIIIGLLIQMILAQTKTIRVKSQPYHYN